MKENRHGRQNAGRLTGLIAALTVAVLLAAVPVAASSTVTGSDVMIRNSAEEKNGEKNNIIGSLNLGDKVTVKSRTTDASGQEWYLVELPNGNTGYVKSQWVDVDGASVETQTETQTQEEPEQEAEQQNAAEDTAVSPGAPDEEPAEPADADIDDWTLEEAGDDGGAAVNADVSDGGNQEEVPGAEEDQKTPEVDNGDAYDPFTDPNAQYSINYVTEKDGTGNWYIFNYDTNKRIRLGDLKELNDAQTSAQKNASSTGIWRTIACILLILVIALLIFLYIIIRRNSPGSGSGPSRRSRRQRRAVAEEDDEDDDFYYTGEETGEAATGTAALKQEEEDAEPDQAPSKKSKRSSGKAGKEDRSGSDEEEDADYDSGEEEDDSEDLDDDSDDDSDDDLYDDYDDDLMEDEDYDDEDRLSGRGGFLGFFKNIFSRDGLEDDYDEDDEIEDDDLYDDDMDYGEDVEEEEEAAEEIPPVKKTRARSRRFEEVQEPAPAPRPRKRPARNISFDEALDYPEDEELLSAVGRASGNGNEAEDTAEIPIEKKEPGDAGKAAQKPAKRQTPAVSEDPDEEFFADEDDDMEYSFLNSPSRRSPR